MAGKLQRVWRRILMWRRRAQENRDLEEELRAHLAIEAAEQREPDGNPREADLAARRAFGNLTQLAEDCRDIWRIAWLDELGQDIHYAARNLRKNPGFTGTAIAVLALAIGAKHSVISSCA
jgi:hypothetical protein